jgi:hypothetical protein
MRNENMQNANVRSFQKEKITKFELEKLLSVTARRTLKLIFCMEKLEKTMVG